MKKLITKILVSLMAIAIICCTMAIGAFAESTIITTTLDFTTATEDLSGDGYFWDNTNKLLIVDGLTMQVSGDKGIILPESSKIIVNGKLDIISDDYEGIYSEGDLDIEINAETNINADDECIKSDGLRLTINEKTDLVSESDAFYIDGDCSVSGTGDLTIKAGNNAFIVEDTLNIDLVGDLTVQSTYAPIYAGSDIDITVVGDVLINSDEDVAIYSETGDVDMNITGDTVINSGDYGVICMCSQDFTFNGNVQFNVPDGYLGIYAVGQNNATSYLTLHTLVENIEDVFGSIDVGEELIVTMVADSDVVIEDDFAFEQPTHLKFAENSSLVIENPDHNVIKSLYVDFSNAKIDFANANITNNETLILPAGTNPDDIKFNGMGTVIVKSSNPMALDKAYDNQGNPAYVGENINLTETEVTDSDYYSWTKDENGVYTFEPKTGVIHADVYVQVENAILNLKQDTIINGIFMGIKENSMMGEYNNPCNLTVTGDYTLKFMEDVISYGNTNLTIDKGTTLDCFTGGVVLVNIGNLDNNFGPSTLTVNGTLKTRIVIFSDMIVGNNASVYVEKSEGGISSRGAFLTGMKKDVVPTLTLGDEVKFITPENAVFVNTNTDGYYNSVVVDDANATTPLDIIKIGKKDKFVITVKKTGEGTITPSGDTVEVYEQNDKEFTFIPATGYEISDVKVDGTSIGAVDSYEFKGVSSNATIEVVFALIPETDVPNTGDNNMPQIFVGAMLISILGAVVLLKKRKFLS